MRSFTHRHALRRIQNGWIWKCLCSGDETYVSDLEHFVKQAVTDELMSVMSDDYNDGKKTPVEVTFSLRPIEKQAEE